MIQLSQHLFDVDELIRKDSQIRLYSLNKKITLFCLALKVTSRKRVIKDKRITKQRHCKKTYLENQGDAEVPSPRVWKQSTTRSRQKTTRIRWNSKRRPARSTSIVNQLELWKCPEGIVVFFWLNFSVSHCNRRSCEPLSSSISWMNLDDNFGFWEWKKEIGFLWVELFLSPSHYSSIGALQSLIVNSRYWGGSWYASHELRPPVVRNQSVLFIGLYGNILHLQIYSSRNLNWNWNLVSGSRLPDQTC